MGVYEWASLSWPALRTLDPARLIAVLPLGAVEAHGPHLPLGTDILIADAMARAGAARLARRGFEAVVMPCVPFAPAPFAAGFAGTIDVPAGATTAVLAGIAASLGRFGVRALVIANAHHDPAHVAAIRGAVASPAALTIVFPDLTRRQWAARLGDEFRGGACHAGRYEGSIVMAVAPERVDAATMRALAPNPASLVTAIARGDATFAAAGGPDAYFGWPADASAEEGRATIEALATILEEAVVADIGEPGMRDEEPAGAAADAHRAAGLRLVNPADLGAPRGFSHGAVSPAGWATLSVAGQTAAETDGEDVSALSFADQFERALARVVAVVHAGGSAPELVTRMTVYVTDMAQYRDSRDRLGSIWRRHMGTHYPAMALVAVGALVDRGATVEIEADAAVPPPSPHRP